MFNQLTKLFGNKAAKEVARLQPYVSAIHARCEALAGMPDAALRAESTRLRQGIQDGLKEHDTALAELQQADSSQSLLETSSSKEYTKKIELLRAQRKSTLGDLLDKALVPAFALMRETTRRLASQEALRLPATPWDREMAAKLQHKAHPYVRIEGEEAVWLNKWEVAGRLLSWDMVYYDVQLLGGIVLHQGKIAEMATGEGKTLVSTLPAFLNALPGLGVHIVTVNDYLAKRDMEWNAPLFEFHGMSVDCIDIHEAHAMARAKSYQADIVYGTNNEFGFDYLRDNMAQDPEELVQRGHAFAMIDEVDSILIDEARTPLIISGPMARSNEKRFIDLRHHVQRLVEAQKKLCAGYLNEAKQAIAAGNKKEGGVPLFRCLRGLPKYRPLIRYLSEQGIKQIMQRTENIYLQDNQRLMPEADAPLYFVIDEKNNNIDLTEKGLDLISDSQEEKDLFIMPDMGSEISSIEQNTSLSQEEQLAQKEKSMQAYAEKSERIHTLNQLLRAYTLYEKDVAYVVMDDAVKIVDEQTGRILDGRRYSDGLHQALEAKENVKVEHSTQTYATITLQNYFRMYDKLSGMTGTAETEAGEFWDIYKLDVAVVPTHMPLIRGDRNDKVYKTVREKYQAITEEINVLRKAARPVLVGTTSVDISELLSRMLRLQRIPHQVLNAKQHQREAFVVAEAGKPGTVTIATNMAGRGTDIKLDEASRKAGGLAIIGSERHEARRVDRQLRGRSGRQGDPGSSQFYVSLEDTLMRLFGSERVARWMDRMGLKEGEVIEHRMITASITRAQRKVEENNFGIRKRLLEYDNVMNAQREVIYTKRRHALLGQRVQADLGEMFRDVCSQLAHELVAEQANQDPSVALPEGGWQLQLLSVFGSDLGITALSKDVHVLTESLLKAALASYEARKKQLVQNVLPVLQHAHLNYGDQLEEVVISLQSSQRTLRMRINLETCLKTEGKEFLDVMEKTVCLQSIDMLWKEHLSEIDDLKQTIQNVVYEQKDPLLVYKFEAFELFQRFITRLNRDTVQFLMRSETPQPKEKDAASPLVSASVPAATHRKPKLKESKADVVHSINNPQAQKEDSSVQETTPLRVEKVAGRNDKVTVQYTDGQILREVKYKKVFRDIEENRCVLLEVHG